MAALTLWALNTVAGWDPEPLVEALARPTQFGGTNDVVAGNRAEFNRDPRDGSTRHALSHEDGDALFNEYFVPIAVKCLGDPERFQRKFAPRFTAAGRARFDRICAYYDEYFAPENGTRWRGYWVPSPDGVVMATREPGMGLYEVLDAFEPQRMAVLVGYSQGGLVARYLAWLDEKLFRPEHRRVCAVVTVQSPNRGSPFANQRNEATVAAGLLGMLTGVAGFPIAPAGTNPRTAAAIAALTHGRFGTSHFSAHTLAELLDAARADASAEHPGLPGSMEQALVTRVPKTGEGQRFRLVVTLRKWLSGLVPLHDFPTAFSDLNPMDLDRPDSVLGALAHEPLNATWVGAVVGTDNRLADLASDGRTWWQKWAIRYAGALQRVAGVLGHAEAAYSGVAMGDSPVDAGERQRQMQRDFAEGTRVEAPGGESVPIAPLAHDFIIPSASQAALGADAPGFLGNLVHPGATHLGGSLAEGSESDQRRVLQLLERLGREVRVRVLP